MSVPKAQAKPQITFIIYLPNSDQLDVGRQLADLEFQGMVNGGYSVRGTLYDPQFNVLNKLISSGYFEKSRTEPVTVKFQLRWGLKSETSFPETATKEQIAYLVSLEASGGGADKGELKFIAIDPPSWLLNTGDANGGVYKGRVSDAIKQVIEEYAPDVELQIGKTIDSKEGKWWMLRQDPKTFISSLFDWSASVTKTKTQWIFIPDGMKLTIKDQGSLSSTKRAFYRHFDAKSVDTIKSWEFLADNALSIAQTKLITQGLSAISGEYLDRITDKEEKKVFVKDSRTEKKKIAKIKKDQGFTKPDDSVGSGPQEIGWSAVTTIPEIYSAGDLGLRYSEYLDGRPRAMWLNLVNALMRVKIECIGHGEWSSCEGLGVDTVFIKWVSMESKKDPKKFWWMTGTWLVYGFHHRLSKGFWFTDLYLARYDHDSKAIKVGGSSQ